MDVAEKNRPDTSQTEVENNDNKYNLQVLRFGFKLKTTIIHCSNVTTQKHTRPFIDSGQRPFFSKLN